EEVRTLVILDAAPPGPMRTRADRVRARADVIRRDAHGRGVRHAAVVTGRGVVFATRSTVRHARRRVALASAGLVPRRGLAQYELFLRLNSRMAGEYRPSGSFRGPAVVVRTAESNDLYGAAADMPDLGWSQWIEGRISVVELPGAHLDLLRPP